MTAVSDAGPLIHLAQIGKLHLLEKLFEKVAIVPTVKREVVDEGIRLGYQDAASVKAALDMGLVVVARPNSRIVKRAAKLARHERISDSDSQTLLVAKVKDKPLLTDEKPLSVLGKMYGLQVWSTWTILLEALRMGLIANADVEEAIDELAEKRHKLSAKQAKEILDAAQRIASSHSMNTRRPTNRNSER